MNNEQEFDMEEFFPSEDENKETESVLDGGEWSEDDLPPFDFAKEQTIELKDGTRCTFAIPSLDSERRYDALQKTVKTVSGKTINGKNPSQEKTHITKAQIVKFVQNAKRLEGFIWKALNEDKPRIVDAQEVAIESEDGMKKKDKTFAMLVPVRNMRSFINRLYGGKMELMVIRNGELIPIEDVKKYDSEGVAVGGDEDFVVVKHTLGIEENADGSTTKPSNIIYYYLKQPTDYHLNKWENVTGGYKVPTKDGGHIETINFYTGKVVDMFDSLIHEIRNATFNGDQFDVNNKAHIVPHGVRRNVISFAFAYWLKDVGNE